MENLYTDKDTIFVQIACYRDSELQHTLQDLFKKAKRPKNIFVGIYLQYDMMEGTDKHLFEVPFPNPNQLRIVEKDYRENGERGGAWSRAQAQKLYNGEKWSILIDAHFRFKENWDEELVNAVLNLDSDGKAVISQCPPTYNKVTQELQMDCANRIRCQTFIGTYGNYRTYEYPAAPNLTIFIYGCFAFGLSEYISEIAINPFWTSLLEVPYSVTLWTRGVNIYSYHKPIIWHHWPDEEEAKKNVVRKKYLIPTAPASEMMHDLLSIKKSDSEEVLKINEEYPIFKERTLRDYERFSGCNMRRKQLREYTKQGAFEKWQEVSKRDEIKKIFNHEF